MKTITTVALVAAIGLGAFLILKRGGIKAGGAVAGIVNGAARATGLPAYSASQDLYQASGNKGMTMRDQYEQYGAGRRVAEVYDQRGMTGLGMAGGYDK